MPGRKSTGPPSLNKARQKKPDKKRSLNALSIADEAAPSKTKIRKARLGELEEPQQSKRKRNSGEDDGVSDDESTKRPRHAQRNDVTQANENVEFGSDDSGNEWVTGQIEDDDDSELDSDEAMGDSDEERFAGFTFRGSSSQGRPKTARQQARAQESDGEDGGFGLQEEDDIDEADDFGDDGVDLADVLEEEEDENVIQSVGNSRRDNHNEPESVPYDSDDELEEEDDAKLASLHGLVSEMNRGNEDREELKILESQEKMPPPAFGSTARRKLTVADIAATIADPELRKSLKFLEEGGTKSSSSRKGIPQKLEVPLPKRQQDRIDRAAAYDKTKETLSRWIETVKHNRRAEHLSFPLRYPDTSAPLGQRRLVPTSQSKPVTELEATVQQIMQESGLAQTDGKSGEDSIRAFEDMKTKKMPIEEVLARRAELRKHRDLLFREEIRAKRIKKIKSKRYRKINRRERDRSAAQIKEAMGSDANSEDEKERQDRKRAEERMGAKHRASRWAKGVKDSGRSKWDADAREGVEEMARRREELRRRMHGQDIHSDEEIGETSEDEESDDDEEPQESGQSQLPKRLQNLMNANKDQVSAQSNLSRMAFMLKADAIQQAQNDEEIEGLRKDYQDEDNGSSDEESQVESGGRQTYGPEKTKQTQPTSVRRTQRSEFEEGEPSDEDDTLERRRKDVDIDRIAINPGLAVEASSFASSKPYLPGNKAVTSSWNDKRPARGAKKPNAEEMDGHSDEDETRQLELGNTNHQRKPPHGHRADTSNDDQDDDSEVELPLTFTNAELARRAFAGDDVLEQKFVKEKEELTREQDDQVIDNTLPGWGTWTGAGISKKAAKPRGPHREIKKVSGIAPENRKDAKLKDVIISEKKVKKNGKYLASQLPHPFETRAQYERSLRLPVGPEWTTKESFQGMTKPKILMKQGIIAPIAKPIV